MRFDFLESVATTLLTSTSPGRNSAGRSTNFENNTPMDALHVVILSGFACPAKLELVCLAACNACRESSAGYSLVVKDTNIRLVLPRTPEWRESWSPPSSDGSDENANNSRSSPSDVVKGAGSESSIPPPRHQRHGRISPHRLISRLVYHVDLPPSQAVWPDGLRALSFGWRYNHPLYRPLPASLVSLDLGNAFNRHIEGFTWPPRLSSLRFGDAFNRQVELATWPTTLRELTFGASFNQPIRSVRWPPALEVLQLGDGFNHSLHGVHWSGATNLWRLEFGAAFRCSVDGVVWPPGLRVLQFGACFDQPLDAAELPRSLRLLSLSDLYEMYDEFEPARMPKGCRLRIYRTTGFDHLTF